ncbi:MAG: hypothetical protein LBL23_05675 [Coriobacteriales bacterium]|jgi:uncharacterized protein (DUF697 family)|nr:hypothetical protein [Coriobacteriales bacterium]
MARPKIPININTLTKAGKLFEAESDSDFCIEVLVDSSASRRLVAQCRKVLQVRPGTAELTVSSFDETMPVLNKDAGLTIVVAGSSPFLRRITEIALWSGTHCVVLSEDAAAVVATVPEEDALEIARTIVEVDVNKPEEALEHDLAAWCVAHLPEFRLSLGTAFVFMRKAIAKDFTRQTSLENAVIAAVFFLPGADLPVLTLNQCKLLYQIAVINEVPLTRERLADVALVVASAFGLRALTRVAVHRFVPVGWLVRGITAFGATLLLGHLGNQLYSSGGGVVELVKGRFHKEAPGEEAITLLSEAPPSNPADAAAQNGAASEARTLQQSGEAH